jgi:hypothetical protein
MRLSGRAGGYAVGGNSGIESDQGTLEQAVRIDGRRIWRP